MAHTTMRPHQTSVERPETPLTRCLDPGLMDLQRANLDTLVEAQKRLCAAAQAIVELRFGWLETSAQTAHAMALSTSRPEAVQDELRQANERAASMMKRELEISLQVQSEVATMLLRLAGLNWRQLQGRDSD